MLTIKQLCIASHSIAKEKSFWDKERNEGELIALMHSELSEALEALRHGNPKSEHIPEFSAVEEELADCCIRIFDLCQAKGYRLEEALKAKIKFNSSRPKLHGKKF